MTLPHVQLKGYNFDVLEEYQSWVHRMAENMVINSISYQNFEERKNWFFSLQKEHILIPVDALANIYWPALWLRSAKQLQPFSRALMFHWLGLHQLKALIWPPITRVESDQRTLLMCSSMREMCRCDGHWPTWSLCKKSPTGCQP